MQNDEILEIGLDGEEQLYVKPATVKLPYIYRESMEVHWETEGSYLYSPKPTEWSYLDWYKQIISAAREQSCNLLVSKQTRWVNVPDSLKAEILEA